MCFHSTASSVTVNSSLSWDYVVELCNSIVSWDDSDLKNHIVEVFIPSYLVFECEDKWLVFLTFEEASCYVSVTIWVKLSVLVNKLLSTAD